MADLVFVLDRDWTVCVDTRSQPQAVPLASVRHLALETDHAGYVIATQNLVEATDIPGVAEIVDRHPDDNYEWLDELQESGRWERFPTRRERLGLIADLHPETDARVVVDDTDLSDVSGWDHYHACDFVPAVERLDDELLEIRAAEPGREYQTLDDGGLGFPVMGR